MHTVYKSYQSLALRKMRHKCLPGFKVSLSYLIKFQANLVFRVKV